MAGRAVVCERLAMIPVECVARGYLTGSGWVEYAERGTVCGIALPAGLVDGSRLPEPIFTPATKAPLGEHDENLDFDAVVASVGGVVAERIRELTLAVYAPGRGDRPRARADPGRHQVRVRPAGRRHHRAGRRGADAGLVPLLGRGELAAGRPAGLLRQAVRPGLAAARIGLGPSTPVQPRPPLPPEIVAATRAKYVQAYERLTGLAFETP